MIFSDFHIIFRLCRSLFMRFFMSVFTYKLYFLLNRNCQSKFTLSLWIITIIHKYMWVIRTRLFPAIYQIYVCTMRNVIISLRCVEQKSCFRINWECLIATESTPFTSDNKTKRFAKVTEFSEHKSPPRVLSI